MNHEKKFRYQIRNDIENVIKAQNINRKHFHEADKFNYAKIIRKFYYTFCEYPVFHTTPEKIQIDYLWTSFRKHLQYSESILDNSWEDCLKAIRNWIPDKNPSHNYYLMTYCGWLYEGTIDGILEFIAELPLMIREFYIFPKDYHFTIIYDNDSEHFRMCYHPNKQKYT